MKEFSPLSNEKVNDAIDQACESTSNRQEGISFFRFQQKHVEQYPDFFENGVSILIQNPSMVLETENNSFAFLLKEHQGAMAFVSFYLSYSTWDGRMLYMDSVRTSTTTTTAQDDDDYCQQGGDSLLLSSEFSIYYTLADIALQLDCQRFSWQHTSPCPVFPGNMVAENLKGLLVLHQSLSSSSSPEEDLPVSSEQSGDDGGDGRQPQQQRLCTALLREKLKKILATLHKEEPSMSLRLATVEDIPHMERLVHGLAVHVQEPDAVHTTAEHFRCDGYESDPPLYYTFLIEEGGGVVVGMAVCYVACKRMTVCRFGRFLYLEDLFIEKESRGKGIGSKVMKWLAHDIAANTFECSRMEWTALDWNTPALTFYEKIGAKVQKDVQISRFAGDALHAFVKSRPEHF